jgi:3-oxoacyl-[acyl-carrier-protein] synthase-3
MPFLKAHIKHISYHLPDKVFSNDDFFSIFPEALKNSDSFHKIGIKQRHLVSDGELASDLAVKSGRKLFKEHSIDPKSIDFLLFCAQEFDYYTPTTACVIQERLNLPKHCGALDFNLGCSGYTYGLSLAKGLIEGVGLKNVLLLTSSTLSRKVHPKDRSLRFLFGDAACATLISSRETDGIHNFVFGTDGSGSEKIIIKDGGARNAIQDESYHEIIDDFGNITSKMHMDMNGVSVFSFSVKTVPAMIEELFAKNNKQLADIDLFIFHQANLFIIETIRKKMNIPNEKVFNYIELVGNTVASSIPIALCEAIKCGRAKKGSTILLVGFGVGLSWSGTIITL